MSVFYRERDEALRLMQRSATRHGVSSIDILSARRDTATVRARYSAILAVKARFPHWSMPQMGRFFNRHHTTILHAYRTAPALGLGVSASPKRLAPVPSVTASLQFCQEPGDDCADQDHFPSLLPREQSSHEGEQQCRLIRPEIGEPLQKLGACPCPT